MPKDWKEWDSEEMSFKEEELETHQICLLKEKNNLSEKKDSGIPKREIKKETTFEESLEDNKENFWLLKKLLWNLLTIITPTKI